ncbi:MAG: hypothetical protein KDB22_17545 [Planctomycetales bacterium]|nr:hypothetical protein [Planctomycetales bacterium]
MNVPPTKVLTRNQLTAALVLVTLLPFCMVVIMYATVPETEAPVLDAEIRIGPEAWPSRDAEDARIVPSAIVTNPTAEPWQNVNLSINHQFHFAQPGIIRAGEQFSVPLKFFHTKGNQYFPPESQRMRTLTIYAQIPSGARAIMEVEGQDLAQELLSRSDALAE